MAVASVNAELVNLVVRAQSGPSQGLDVALRVFVDNDISVCGVLRGSPRMQGWGAGLQDPSHLKCVRFEDLCLNGVSEEVVLLLRRVWWRCAKAHRPGNEAGRASKRCVHMCSSLVDRGLLPFPAGRRRHPGGVETVYSSPAGFTCLWLVFAGCSLLRVWVRRRLRSAWCRAGSRRACPPSPADLAALWSP